MQKKHETEKQAAIQEFNNFKAKIAERDQKLAQGFQKKYDSLRTELEGMNKKFQERVEGFESTNKELKRALEDTSKTGSAGMQELRQKYEAEMAELVRSSNDKYQAMLAEQLGIQSALKKEMEARLEQLRKELSEQHLRDLQNEVGKERAMLGGDKQEALMALRRELEEQLAQQKATLTAQVDRLTTEAKAQTEECALVKSKGELAVADLKAQLEALQRSMADTAGGQEAQMVALNRDVAALKEQLSAAQARVMQREEELTTMRSMLAEKNTQLVQHEDRYKEAQQEIHHLRAELESAQKSGASSTDELRQKLAVAQKEADSFRAEINQIAASLATVRDELKKAEKAATKTAAEHAKVVEGLNNEREMLLNKIQELRAAAGSASAEAVGEMESLRKSMESKVAQLQQEKLLAAQESERLVATLTENHRAELEGQKAAHKLAVEGMEQKQKEWSEEKAGLVSRHSTEIASLKAEYEQQLEAAGAKHEAEASTLKASLSALEGQLQSLSEQADSERSTLKAEATKWEGKVKGLQKELDARKKDGERAESVTSGLKNQVESLREELKASQKAFREKMDMSSAKLEAEWQSRLDAQQEASELALAALRAELVKAHQTELDAIAQRHDEDIRSLKSLLQKEHTAAANELADNERLRLQLEADLKAEKSARAAQVADLSSTHSTQLRAAEDAHRQEAERLRRELKNAAEGREQQLLQAHAAEVERLNNLLEGTTVEYTQRMASAIETAKLAAEESLRQALSEQDSRLKRQHMEALDAQAREHAEITKALTAKFEAEKQAMLKNIAEMQQQQVDATAQIAGMEKVIATERKERQRREEGFVLERDQLERAHDSDIRREKESAERKIIEVMERANADINILKGEHVQVRAQYEERIQEITSQFRALEKRYLNRESREEDLARIQQLQQEMVEKDELVLRTREEMQYFKREMLNREENYNQKFGKSPNVGVMQVIKTKDPTEGAANSGKAKPTQMRLVNPNGGNSMGGMGGGLGIGGISGGGGGSVKGGRPGK